MNESLFEQLAQFKIVFEVFQLICALTIMIHGFLPSILGGTAILMDVLSDTVMANTSSLPTKKQL